jgi:conjugal transfer pilus assembly protein TraE
MKPQELAREIKVRTGIRSALLALIALLVVSNAVLAVGLVGADRTHRETLIPPTVTRTFWIEDDAVSPSYLEEMGLFVLRNALDVTPASAEYQARVVLRYADARSYGTLEKELLANARRMKESNVSTFFSVTSVAVDPKQNSVAFSGGLHTILGDKSVSENRRTYVVRFAMANGKVVVRELNETTSAKPFDSQAEGEQK